MRSTKLSPLTRCLVDTSAYFALSDHTDANHESSLRIAGWLADNHVRLVTTNFILAETHALVLARVNRAVAWHVLFEIDHSSTTIVRVSSRDEQRAREILAQYADKEFSLTDATSFSVMERLGLTHAFSFDRDFAQYGLIQVTPELL